MCIWPIWPLGLLRHLMCISRQSGIQFGWSLRQKLAALMVFGQAMENDLQKARRKFWSTVRHLKRGQEVRHCVQWGCGTAYLDSTPATLSGHWRQCLWIVRPGWWSPFIRMGIARCAPNKGESHSSASLVGSIQGCRARWEIESQIQKKECGFHPGQETVDEVLMLTVFWAFLVQSFHSPILLN